MSQRRSILERRRNFAIDEINQIELKSELRDLSDDDNVVSKTYESRILKGESCSDESKFKNSEIYEMER
ncbi:hypothetical protein TNCV_2247601 [Trichonephila clavipes]|nr:hypothetical protein TNCV_2247601 [Trichonephila clavipes]